MTFTSRNLTLDAQSQQESHVKWTSLCIEPNAKSLKLFNPQSQPKMPSDNHCANRGWSGELDRYDPGHGCRVGSRLAANAIPVHHGTTARIHQSDALRRARLDRRELFDPGLLWRNAPSRSGGAGGARRP